MLNIFTPKECAPPWSLGCVYKCQICQVKFQTLTSFQSHLFFHSLSVVQYTCLYGEAVDTCQHHTCQICGVLVQQVEFFNKVLYGEIVFLFHTSFTVVHFHNFFQSR